MGERRYKAFLSYSHRDKAVAEWLHRALETYRIPDDLVAKGAPARLHPIFKDREELAAADSLGDAIERAIADSDALIVLCSPDAASSPWIAKEVDAFKRIHGDRDVYPVVVAGDAPDNFPPPLRTHYEHGAPTDSDAEPVAADLRPEGDGKKLGRLKLVAGLAGVPLDALVQRDQARKQKRLAMVAAASLLGMVGTSGLALYAIDQRDEAREQRAEADGLIEFMLTDLRKQLEPVGRLELLDSVGARALDYYARQKLKEMSHSELGRRARAVQLVAEVQNLRGNNDEALPAFREAARTTAELLARRPNDPEAMFNHGQSLFWVGYIAWQRGDMKEAETALKGYADISERLAARDADNLDWQMEAAYSQTNLGALAEEGGRLKEALRYFEAGANRTAEVAEKEGRPEARMIELAEASSWVASTQRRLGRWEDSEKTRQREVDIYRAILEKDPNNYDALQAHVFASAQLGDLHMHMGRLREARADLGRAIADARRLRAHEPDNSLFIELMMPAWRDRALLNWSEGRHADAAADFAEAAALVENLRRRDANNPSWAIEAPLDTALYRAFTERFDMPAPRMSALSGRWLERLKGKTGNYYWQRIGLHVLAGVAAQRSGKPDVARAAFLRALAEKSAREDGDFDPRALALRAFAAQRTGQRAAAQAYRQKLSEMDVDTPLDDALVRL